MSRSKPRKKSAKSERSRGRGKAIFAVVTVTVLLVAAYIVLQPPHTAIGPGDFAPNFTLPVVNAAGLTDQTVTLSSFRGKVVVLQFMVSWCRVCQEMSSSVEYLYGEYQDRGVVFLSVAATYNGATANSTAAFIRQYKVTSTHVLDTENSVFANYGVEATPTYLVLDTSGKVTSRFQGVVATEAFATAIDQALST